MPRLYLSPPHMSADERDLLIEAFDSNWIAPLGPHVDAFERELAARVDAPAAVALSSGTAALHLALLLAGVQPGDVVLTSTLTFAATANAATYVGALPAFIDAHPDTWTLDPLRVAEALDHFASLGRRVGALITVDLYGQCADHDPICAACDAHNVPVIEDAAEALGATYRGRHAGTLAPLGVFSFNGNKIITTSGGGMLTCRDPDLAARARHLATQARDPAPHYQHSEIGFNYRLSNLLAAVGRGQLRALDDRVRARRAINRHYRDALADLPGLHFMPEAPYGDCTFWLTTLTVDPDAFGADREALRLRLNELDIEARPVWKPMHLQPVFADHPRFGGQVAERLFDRGLCLPSGSAMSSDDLARVCDAIRAVHRQASTVNAR